MKPDALVATVGLAGLFQLQVMRWRAQGAAEVQWYETANENTPFPSVGWNNLIEQAQLSPSTGVLGLVGIAIFAFAVWKFSGGSRAPWDRILGYAQRDRAVVKATSVMRDEYDAYGKLRDTQIALSRKQVGSRLAKEAENVAEILKIKDAIVVRRQEVRSTIAEWTIVGGTLLRTYRSVNIDARGMLDPPPYFDTIPRSDLFDNRMPNLEPVLATAENAVAQHESNLRVLAEWEAEVVVLAERARGEFVQALEQAKNDLSGGPNPPAPPALPRSDRWTDQT